MLKRLICSIVCFTFIFSNLQYVHAQDFSINQLPVPGIMVGESAPFAPLALKGLIVNPQKPLEFQFIIDTGDEYRHPERSEGSQQEQLKTQSTQLVKYFLAGLTIPEGDLWVNLSPYEKDRMVPMALGQTDLGRDLLAQDYILKQLTASLIYPEKDLGKEFWSRVYAKAQKQFGTTNIPVNTFNKVWILPDQAQVYENHNAAYVTKATLKVMLDEDYTALQKKGTDTNSALRPILGQELVSVPDNNAHSLASQIIKQIVLPEIEKEVNTGKNFAPLRQIYQALILAKWYKQTIQNALLDTIYTNKNKVAGVNLNDPTIKQQIYNRYLQAYKKGAFNYIKEAPTPDGQILPRKYFSGGFTEMGMNINRSGRQSDFKSDGAMLSLTMGLVAAGTVALIAGRLVVKSKIQKAKQKKQEEDKLRQIENDAKQKNQEEDKLRKIENDRENRSRVFNNYILALLSKDKEIRFKAAYELGNLDDTRAIRPLIEILNDSDMRTRVQTAVSLARLGDVSGKQILLDSISDPELMFPFSRNHLEFDLDHGIQFSGRIYSALNKIGPTSEEMFQAQINGLNFDVDKHDDWQELILQTATRFLGAYGDKRAIRPLKEALQKAKLRKDLEGKLWEISKAIEQLEIFGNRPKNSKYIPEVETFTFKSVSQGENQGWHLYLSEEFPGLEFHEVLDKENPWPYGKSDQTIGVVAIEKVNKKLFEAVHSHHKDVAKELIAKGASVAKARGYLKYTVLMLAVDEKITDIDFMNFLLKNGADLNVKNELGSTALMMAAREGRKYAVKLLLAEGADVNVKNNKGETALSLAHEYKHPDIVEIFADAGHVDVYARDSYGKTDLIVAAINGRKNIVELLLAKGANVNAKDTFGHTALWYAEGKKEIVEILKAAGAKDEAMLQAPNKDAAMVGTNELTIRTISTLVSDGIYSMSNLFRGVIHGKFSPKVSVDELKNLPVDSVAYRLSRTGELTPMDVSILKASPGAYAESSDIYLPVPQKAPTVVIIKDDYIPASPDKALLAKNGGIDLNQINVLRNGKTVNVQFDQAQLNALEQGGFEGFTPVIISMTPIRSPFNY